jgi:transposase
MLYSRLVFTTTNQINTFVWIILTSVLRHVSPRIGVFLRAGLIQNIVARHFSVHRNTMQSLLRRFRQSGNTKDRSGRPRVTSRQQDKRHIRLVHLWDRCQTSSFTARSILGLRPISYRTVDNRLRDRHIRPRRPAIRPILLPRHRAARLTWYRRHLRFRR